MHLLPQGIPPFPSKNHCKWSSISLSCGFFDKILQLVYLNTRKQTKKHEVPNIVAESIVESNNFIVCFEGDMPLTDGFIIWDDSNPIKSHEPSIPVCLTERFGGSVTGFVASHRLLPALVSLSWFVSVGRRTRGSTRCSLYLVGIMDLALRCETIWVIE